MGHRVSWKELPANSPERQQFVRKTLTTVFCALLIDILAFTIILPLFPRLLEHYEQVDGANESSTYFRMRTVIQSFRDMLGVSGSRLDIILFGGALGSLFSFLQFISSPIIGRLSDKYGRRSVLLLSMLGNGVSMLLWIFSGSFTTFVWSRIIGGLTEGNVQMSIAMISDVTTPETRSRGLALVGIAFSLGFTVGPPLGAYFTSFDLIELIPALEGLPINRYSSPALFAFILIVIETIYLGVSLPETINFRSSSDKRSSDAAASPRRSARLANKANPAVASAGKAMSKSDRKLWALSLIHFLFLFFFSGMEFTLTFLTHDRFGFSHGQQGRLLAFIGVLSALVQGGYTRRVAHKRVHERTLVAQGIAACGIGLAVLGVQAYSLGWLYLGAAFLAFTSGTVVTGLTSLVSYETGAGEKTVDATAEDNSDRGQVLGKFRSVGQLGRSLGPIFACTNYWILGSSAAYSGAAFAMGALVVLVMTFAPGPPKKIAPEVRVQQRAGVDDLISPISVTEGAAIQGSTTTRRVRGKSMEH
ncbi:uncharacterized protein SPPG_05058 [Spizellomyces punctatus DAOM BR117]|uniref:Major facilitator superfamily (MFS) profile domain-containing protein n=1 Tax=Spizellomyces punctatus (strain DAOM BR117) TaxID=645134 RepID=A0A0L0HDZ6_SPIPD|nr:uncharacterized protein SPPG_05058 [Spizellomyces punctatus DAOM BR117]KNC99675.1 hypothetical protein SPPG_05058 [Spizellomyces punctatus DAOM BR117]|eukprot:XP_016607715.1 hypothetical protein SPPG_05058 [Spizellomyces punctatus DAOM BR117]